MTNRRMFLTGSAVAVVGAGSAAFLNFPVAAQQTAGQDVTQELLRQLRSGLEKLKEGKGEGARQLASTLRIYGATLKETEPARLAAIQQQLKARGRAGLLYLPPRHNQAEVERLGKAIGFPMHLLPPHGAGDLAKREEVLNIILNDGGLPTIFARAAEELDKAGAVMDERGGGIRLAQLSDNDSCASGACGLADAAEEAMTLYCALAVIFPWFIPACEGAIAAWLTLMAACIACKLFG